MRIVQAELINRPEQWLKLIELAHRMAAGFTFVRVDFYALPRVVFGEMTLSPGAGNSLFEPVGKDLEIFKIFLT